MSNDRPEDSRRHMRRCTISLPDGKKSFFGIRYFKKILLIIVSSSDDAGCVVNPICALEI